MAEHPNATTVRRMAELMSAGDAEGAASFIADDVEWHEIGRAEPVRGKAALRSHMSEGVDYEITFKVHDVVANDDHTIALGEATATRGGKTLVYRTAEICHVRDGRVTARWAFSDDTAAIVAFFA
jgi:ketosteroid isomerase-like protein